MRFKRGRNDTKHLFAVKNYLKYKYRKTYGDPIGPDYNEIILNDMQTLFDKYKILHGFPEIGQKVTFSRPTKHHWFRSVIENENELVLGNEYTVRDTELNSSSSYIWLEEIPDTDNEERGNKFFNLGAFTWNRDIPTADELIGFGVSDLFRLQNNTYNLVVDPTDFQIYRNGELYLTPIYDKSNGRITGFEQDYKGADKD